MTVMQREQQLGQDLTHNIFGYQFAKETAQKIRRDRNFDLCMTALQGKHGLTPFALRGL